MKFGNITIGKQLFVGWGKPTALGKGENQIRGAAYVEGPMQIGKDSDFDEIDDPTGEKGKNVHGIYNNIILKQADKLKDFITDNRIEVFLRGAGLIQDVLTGGTSQTTVGDLRTNSNLLQRYDDSTNTLFTRWKSRICAWLYYC